MFSIKPPPPEQPPRPKKHPKTHQRDIGMFVEKLFNMVETESDDIISWIPDGTAFLIKSTSDLSREILPKYFRHGKFSSLIRQLNFYSFYKIPSNSVVTYHHSFFRRGRRDLLHHIKRRGAGKPKAVFIDSPHDENIGITKTTTATAPVTPPSMREQFPSPMSKPITMDSMSPLHKPGVPLVLPPPLVDLAPSQLKRKSIDGGGGMDMVKRCRVIATEPEVDVSVFFDIKPEPELHPSPVEELLGTQPPLPPTFSESRSSILSLSRDCLKWPEDEVVGRSKQKMMDYETLRDMSESLEIGEWGRPLSPLNLPEQSTTWLDIAF